LYKSFAQKCGFPNDRAFRVLNVDIQLDSEDPISKLLFSESFVCAASKMAKRIGNYNAAIAVHDIESDIAVPKKLGEFKFVGFFPFDPESEPASTTPTPGSAPGHVSVWAGEFSDQASINEYFALPDYVSRTSDPISPFATDFEIQWYEQDFTTITVSRAFKPSAGSTLMAAFPDKRSLKSMISKAIEETQKEYNFVYLAHDFDYELIEETRFIEFNTGESCEFIGSFSR